jgi:hypothetical protein
MAEENEIVAGFTAREATLVPFGPGVQTFMCVQNIVREGEKE